MLVQIRVDDVAYKQYNIGYHGRYNISILGVTYVDSTDTVGIIQFQSNQLYNSIGQPYLLCSNTTSNRALYASASPECWTWTDKQRSGFIDFKLNNLTSGADPTGLVMCLVDLNIEKVDDEN